MSPIRAAVPHGYLNSYISGSHVGRYLPDVYPTGAKISAACKKAYAGATITLMGALTAGRKVSSRLRHVSSSGLYQGLLRGLVDPRDGGQFRWLWSAVPEALGVGGVGRVQGLLPLGADLGRGAEVH